MAAVPIIINQNMQFTEKCLQSIHTVSTVTVLPSHSSSTAVSTVQYYALHCLVVCKQISVKCLVYFSHELHDCLNVCFFFRICRFL